GERLVDRLCKSGVLSKENVDAVLTQAGGGLLLGDIPIEDCKIVVAASAGATEKLMAQTLAEAIGKLYGKTPRILTDEAPQGRGEITVGQTSRAISAEAKNLKQDEAGVFIEGDSLCICAQSTTWLRRATNWFIENHLTEKREKRLIASDSECGQILENPIFSAIPAGDPHILYDGETGYYYAVYSAPKNDRVTLYRAKTIAELGKAQGKDVYVAGADREIKHKLFAPELHKVDGKWYIYASGATSTEDKNETPSRSVRLFCLEAIGDDPFGDYIFKGFLNDDILAIDAHVFTYKGENYVSAARILSGVGNTIMLAKLENPWTVDTARVAVISTPVLGYETLSGRINEGPFAFEHDGKLFILYSCNDGPNYSLGLLELTGDDLLNKTSWTKHDKAVFTGTASVISPGHCSVFLSPDGSQYWLAYHTSNKAVGRAISIKRFTFDENGQPVLGQPTLGESFFGPRG
ncbi:MAG: glycoside hydrolase family 43 protein, partial [Clostridia bacterium]|nr:glycoside hydrolase family 43 protein [Clostridia bacterium]